MGTDVRKPVGISDRLLTFRVTSPAIVTPALAVLVILLAPPPVVAGDPYLDAINAEGDRLETLGQAKKEEELLRREAPAAAATNRTPGPALAARTKGTGAAPGVKSAMDFENVLHENFPGSYALYAVLDNSEKESVFNEYQKSRSDGPGRFLPVVSRIITLTTIRNRDRRGPNR
jgi:hypothetical protein